MTVTTTKGAAVITITSISPGSSKTAVVPTTEDLSITQIDITAKNSIVNAQLVPTKLSSKPASISQDVSGSVYNYVQIDKTNLDDSSVTSATIKFKVAKSWLTANSIDSATVALYRYSSNAWNKLATTKSSEDSDNVFYSSTTPGFSVFAIAGQAGQATSTNVTTQVGNNTVNKTSINNVSSPASQKGKVIFGVTLIVAAVAVIAFFLLKREKLSLPRASNWNDLRRKYGKR